MSNIKFRGLIFITTDKDKIKIIIHNYNIQ